MLLVFTAHRNKRTKYSSTAGYNSERKTLEEVSFRVVSACETIGGASRTCSAESLPPTLPRVPLTLLVERTGIRKREKRHQYRAAA